VLVTAAVNGVSKKYAVTETPLTILVSNVRFMDDGRPVSATLPVADA
jgi:hypothetical protein